ncbi:MAG TPA: pantoate--beta-alanine ligase, partial [Terriglobales bacterium]|nr:pantoate--beta-alanine ligase [Terriglobales bacterium]
SAITRRVGAGRSAIAGSGCLAGRARRRDAEAAQRMFASELAVRVDYVEIVNPESLEPVTDAQNGTLVAVAAFVGTTRLIDNLLLNN